MDYILSCPFAAAVALLYAQYVPVDLVDLLFNQENKFYNSTLNLTMSLVTKYYP
jgi:hypothetical protein